MIGQTAHHRSTAVTISQKKRTFLLANKKQQELIGHLVRLRTSLVIDSHKIDGRLFGLCFFIYNINRLEAIGYSPVFRMADPEGRDPSP